MKKRILYLIIACLACAGQSAWAYPTSGSVSKHSDGNYYVLDITEEQVNGYSMNGIPSTSSSWDRNLNGPGGKLLVYAYKQSSSYKTSLTVAQGIMKDGGITFSDVRTQDLSNTSYLSEPFSFDLNHNAEAIRLTLKGTRRQWYKNPKVILATYLEGAPASVTLPDGKVGGATFTTFSFKWCNLGGNITIKSNNSLFTLGDTKQTEIYLSAPAGSWNNNQEVKVTCSNTSAGTHTGTITISGGGKEIIVNVSSTVIKNDATITWKIPENVAVGEVFDPAVEAPVLTSFTSSNENVLKIEGTKVTAVGAGDAILTASIKNNASYNDVEESISITVADKERQTIVWDQNIAVIPTSTTTKELTAYAVSSSDPSIRTNLSITYTSSNPSVASVSGNILTIHGVGSTDIKASVAGDDTYFPAYMTKGVVVYNPDEACPDVFLYDSEFQVAIGDFEGDKSVEIDWDAGKAPATLTFSAQSNEEWLSDNETTIEVAQKINSDWSNIQTVTVKKQSASTFADIKLDRQATAIRFLVKWNASGTTVTFSNVEVKQLRYLESDATSISFLPINLGASDLKHITLKYSALQSMCGVSLAKEDKAFKLAEGITFGEGCGSVGTKTFTITFSSEGFTSADCATYENTILIKNSQGDEEMRIPISGTVEQLRQTIDWVRETTTIHTIDEVTVPAQTTANLPITYASSDATTAYVNSEYKLVIIKHGTVTITATAAGDNTYQAATPVAHTFTINPTPYTPTLDAATLERLERIVYGTKLGDIALTGTAQDKAGNVVAGSFAFTAPTLMPPPEAITEYEVTFTPFDLNYYIPTTITTNVTTVPRQEQILTWTQNIAAIPQAAEPITLTATVNTVLDLVYASGDETVVKVEGNTLKVVGIGRTTVTVTQAGTLIYQPVSMTKVVEVYDPNSECPEALLADDAFDLSQGLFGGGTGQQAIGWDNTKPADELRFTVYGEHNFDDPITLSVDVYRKDEPDSKENDWKTVKVTAEKATHAFELDEDIIKVNFRVDWSAANIKTVYLRDVKVTQEHYLTTSIDSHTFEKMDLRKTATKEISIDYSALSTVHSIRLENEDNVFTLQDVEAIGGCGANGTETFRVQFSTEQLSGADVNTTFKNAILVMNAKGEVVKSISVEGSLKQLTWLPVTQDNTPVENNIYKYLMYDAVGIKTAHPTLNYTSDIDVTGKVYYLMQVRAADDWHSFVAPFDIDEAYVLELTPEPASSKGADVIANMISAQRNANMLFFGTVFGDLSKSEDDLMTLITSYLERLDGYASEKVGIWSIHQSYELYEGEDTWQSIVKDNGDIQFVDVWNEITPIHEITPNLMQKGKIYAMRFPWCEYCSDDYRKDNWDYWTEKLILFIGKGNQTVHGSNKHAEITSTLPDEVGTARLTGNYTLVDMDISNAFVHNITTDLYEKVSGEVNVSPTTSVLYAHIPAKQGKRAVAINRSGEIIWEDDPNAGDNSGVVTGLQAAQDAYLRVMSQEGGFSVVSSAAQPIQVYAISGALVYQSEMAAQEARFISAEAGVYVVRTATHAYKVIAR